MFLVLVTRYVNVLYLLLFQFLRALSHLPEPKEVALVSFQG